MFRPANNYVKLTIRTGNTTRDTVIPFRSDSQAEATEALARALDAEVQAKRFGPHRQSSISCFDPTPFIRMGENVPRIGEFAEQDLRHVA